MSIYSRATEERLKKKTFKDWVDMAFLLSIGFDFAAVTLKIPISQRNRYCNKKAIHIEKPAGNYFNGRLAD